MHINTFYVCVYVRRYVCVYTRKQDLKNSRYPFFNKRKPVKNSTFSYLLLCRAEGLLEGLLAAALRKGWKCSVLDSARRNEITRKKKKQHKQQLLG